MATLQQARAEYELSKYAHTICGIGCAIFAYVWCRYVQLFRGDDAVLLSENAAFRSSLNDRIELTILCLGIAIASGDQTVC
jgi:hypothetical protein